MQTKFGAIIVDGSGKTNGHVATKNRNGNALRTKIKPSNKQSAMQMFMRNLFATIANMWNQLTVSQVAAWNAAAENVTYSNAFGDKKKYTGRAYFQKVNALVGMTDQTKMMDEPPTSEGSDEDIVETEDDYWEDYADQIQAHFNNNIPNTTGIIVYCTPALRNGQTYVAGKYKVVGKVVGNGTNTLDITQMITDVYGVPVIGQRFIVYLRLVNNLTAFNKKTVPHTVNVVAHP